MISKIYQRFGFKTYFLFANILILLSNLPLLVHIWRTPPGATFPLYHPQHVPDYNGYLSAITLGQNGFWLFRNPYTSEGSGPILFYFIYVLIGKIFNIFHLSAPVLYHLFRIFSAELFVIGSYLVNRKILGKKYAFAGSLIALILTFFPVLLLVDKGINPSAPPWWSNLDSLERLSAIPHHLISQAFMLFAVAIIIKSLKSPFRQKKYILSASLLSFSAGIIFPPAVFPIIFGIPFYFILKNKSLSSLEAKLCAVVLFPAILSLAIGWLQTRNPALKDVWITWEVNKWNFMEPTFDRNLILAFSFLIVFNIPTMYRFVKSWDFEKIIVVVWAIIPFILLPFVNILGISKIRLVFAAPFVAWGIITTYTLKELMRNRIIAITFFIVITVISLSTTGYTLYLNIRESLNMPIYSNFYFTKDRMDSLEFIKNNIPKNSIFLSDEHIGNIIPSYAPVISYFGHINLTRKFVDKQHNVWMFFNGRFTPGQAKDFLKKGDINYVYWGPDENNLGYGNIPDYKFLGDPVFQDRTVRIYFINQM